MAKRKKRKNRTRTFFPGLPRPKKKTLQKESTSDRSSSDVLKVAAIIAVLTAMATGLFFLDRYVKAIAPTAGRCGPLELVDLPDWARHELKEKIFAAAGAADFQLDEDAARSVAENLAPLPWLTDLRVQTTHKSIRLSAKVRKPVALIKRGLQKFFVDKDLVVLDYVPMPGLPVVRVTGVEAMRVPPFGQPWQTDDLAAALAVLALLDKMDGLVAAHKPLLYEIESIDVTNFRGRRDKRRPHILLYAGDGTRILWGAEVGSSQRHMEAREDEKLAMLYGFYKDNGTLTNRVKYIELRYPRKKVPQPANSF